MVTKVRVETITREALDQRVLEISKLQLVIEGIETEMNQRIDEIKSGYSQDLHVLRQRHEIALKLLRADVEPNRAGLFAKGKKTLKLLFGTISFRQQPDRVSLVKGISEEAATAMLTEAGLLDLVRLKKEIARDVIRIKVRAKELMLVVIERCGIEFHEGSEDFYVEPDRARVSEELNKKQ